MTKEFISGLILGLTLGLLIKVTVTLAGAPNYKEIHSKSVTMTGPLTTIETTTTELDYRRRSK